MKTSFIQKIKEVKNGAASNHPMHLETEGVAIPEVHVDPIPNSAEDTDTANDYEKGLQNINGADSDNSASASASANADSIDFSGAIPEIHFSKEKKSE